MKNALKSMFFQTCKQNLHQKYTIFKSFDMITKYIIKLVLFCYDIKTFNRIHIKSIVAI